MARIWSPLELREVEAIYRRVAPLLKPRARRLLDIARAKLDGERDEGEARGARFELRMLGRLRDTDLRRVELEHPVAAGETRCTVDIYLPDREVGIELKAAQDYIIPPVQVSAECSKEYLEQEYGAAFRHSRSFTDDQAHMLFREVNRKCGEKDLRMATYQTWLVIDTNDTDWLEHYSHRAKSEDEHFGQLGEAFTALVRTPGTVDNPNHILDCQRVSVGFVSSFRGNRPDHLVVFPRNESETTQSPAIAKLFGLQLLVAGER